MTFCVNVCYKVIPHTVNIGHGNIHFNSAHSSLTVVSYGYILGTSGFDYTIHRHAAMHVIEVCIYMTLILTKPTVLNTCLL